MGKRKKELCSVPGCDKVHEAKGYCVRHYYQVKMYGGLHRTPYDPNEFIVEGCTCIIKLFDQHGNYKASALIDAEDLNKVKDYKWHQSDKGYVRRARHKPNLLAQTILNVRTSVQTIVIDHINGNKLDNRKANLRLVTHAQNLQNRVRKHGIGISGFYGVTWKKQHHKWNARVGVNNKRISLGLFDDPIEAAKARDRAAIKYHGEFATLNFPRRRRIG